jgi:hypothetical protein
VCRIAKRCSAGSSDHKCRVRRDTDGAWSCTLQHLALACYFDFLCRNVCINTVHKSKYMHEHVTCHVVYVHTPCRDIAGVRAQVCDAACGHGRAYSPRRPSQNTRVCAGTYASNLFHVLIPSCVLQRTSSPSAHLRDVLHSKRKCVTYFLIKLFFHFNV